MSLFLLLLSSCAAWRAGDVVEMKKLPNDLVPDKQVFKSSLKLMLYEYYINDELDKDKTKDTKEEAFEGQKTLFRFSGERFANGSVHLWHCLA